LKTLLYMAQSANGCIADHKGQTPWSDGGWRKFRKAVKACGNLVIGRRTYEIMEKGGDFDRIGRPYTVIVSRKLRLKPDRNRAVARTPKQALKLLQKAGYLKALIAGGTKLNSSFIERNLVDELVLDVEPFLFGGGTPLLKSRPLMRNLKLLEAKKYQGGFSLHYKIRE
jgi:dihydrofolate reductase